jgi:hypothetical protein
VAEHLITTHVHDNRGRTDDHLVPFEGTIDWPAALTAVQKIGYDPTLLFEIAAYGSPKETLVRAQRAREKLERLLGIRQVIQEPITMDDLKGGICKRSWMFHIEKLNIAIWITGP